MKSRKSSVNLPLVNEEKKANEKKALAWLFLCAIAEAKFEAQKWKNIFATYEDLIKTYKSIKNFSNFNYEKMMGLTSSIIRSHNRGTSPLNFDFDLETNAKFEDFIQSITPEVKEFCNLDFLSKIDKNQSALLKRMLARKLYQIGNGTICNGVIKQIDTDKLDKGTYPFYSFTETGAFNKKTETGKKDKKNARSGKEKAFVIASPIDYKDMIYQIRVSDIRLTPFEPVIVYNRNNSVKNKLWVLSSPMPTCTNDIQGWINGIVDCGYPEKIGTVVNLGEPIIPDEEFNHFFDKLIAAQNDTKRCGLIKGNQINNSYVKTLKSEHEKDHVFYYVGRDSRSAWSEQSYDNDNPNNKKEKQPKPTGATAAWQTFTFTEKMEAEEWLKQMRKVCLASLLKPVCLQSRDVNDPEQKAQASKFALTILLFNLFVQHGQKQVEQWWEEKSETPADLTESLAALRAQINSVQDAKEAYQQASQVYMAVLKELGADKKDLTSQLEKAPNLPYESLQQVAKYIQKKETGGKKSKKDKAQSKDGKTELTEETDPKYYPWSTKTAQDKIEILRPVRDVIEENENQETNTSLPLRVLEIGINLLAAGENPTLYQRRQKGTIGDGKAVLTARKPLKEIKRVIAQLPNSTVALDENARVVNAQRFTVKFESLRPLAVEVDNSPFQDDDSAQVISDNIQTAVMVPGAQPQKPMMEVLPQGTVYTAEMVQVGQAPPSETQPQQQKPPRRVWATLEKARYGQGVMKTDLGDEKHQKELLEKVRQRGLSQGNEFSQDSGLSQDKGEMDWSSKLSTAQLTTNIRRRGTGPLDGVRSRTGSNVDQESNNNNNSMDDAPKVMGQPK